MREPILNQPPRPWKTRTKFFIAWWFTATMYWFFFDGALTGIAQLAAPLWGRSLPWILLGSVAIGFLLALLITVLNWNKLAEPRKDRIHIV